MLSLEEILLVKFNLTAYESELFVNKCQLKNKNLKNLSEYLNTHFAKENLIKTD